MGRKRKDLTGQRFGKLLVLSKDEDHILPSGRHMPKWLCRCDCGNEVSVMRAALTRSVRPTRSCGCISKEFIKTLSRPRMDLIGQRFGRLTVIEKADDYVIPSGFHYAAWKCKCDCGNIAEVKQQKLIQGVTKSCGCFKRENTSKLKLIDLTGRRFGKLTVIERIEGKDKKSVWWKCKCDCGNYKEARSSCLLSGDCKSCGCLVSYGEEEIIKYLNDNNVNYKTQYWFDDLKNNDTNKHLYFDFAIFTDDKLDYLIEYNGEQHYRDCGDFGKLQREKTDVLKKEYCKNHQIPLHIIKYNENIQSALGRII